MNKKGIIIVGKLPPPYIGPAVATQIILNSRLNEEFQLYHLNTTVNKRVEEFGSAGFKKVVKNINIYKRLFSLLRTNKTNLILIPISQTTLGFLKDSVFILMAVAFKTKILLQLRGSNFKNWMKLSNLSTRLYVRFCLKKASGIIVLGENLSHLFEEYYTQEQIHVVPNGCNIKIPVIKKTTGKVNLLYFANFLPSKGIKELLVALIQLNKELQGTFELKAVGAWDNKDYKRACLEIVEEHELPVQFFPPQMGNEKWQKFASADVFIFTPNQPEGHPWVIVEALSAGLPIISTDQGAIVESVIHGENGFIVEKNSPHQIYEQLKKLIEREELRHQLGKRSKELYQERFTEEVMVSNLSKAINKVLQSS